MRVLPFMKRKNGIQFAGVGLDTGGGGGGGGGNSFNISTEETRIGTLNTEPLYAKVFELSSIVTVGTSYTTLVENVGYMDKLFNVILLGEAYSDSHGYSVLRTVTDVRLSDDNKLQADTIDTSGCRVKTVIVFYTKTTD